MSAIVKTDNLLNGIPSYRYEETKKTTLKPGLEGKDMFFALCGMHSVAGFGFAFSSLWMGTDMTTLVGLGLGVAAGVGAQAIDKINKSDTIRYRLGNVSKADTREIIKACRKRNRLKNTGTILEIPSVDGQHAYKIKFGETDLEITSYRVASLKQTWDNQMAMFKSAYGLDTNTSSPQPKPDGCHHELSETNNMGVLNV